MSAKKIKVKIPLLVDLVGESHNKQLTIVIAAIINTFEDSGLLLDKTVYRSLSDLTSSIDALPAEDEHSPGTTLENISSSQNLLKLIPRMNAFLKAICEMHSLKKIVLVVEVPEWRNQGTIDTFVDYFDFKRLKLKFKQIA